MKPLQILSAVSSGTKKEKQAAAKVVKQILEGSKPIAFSWGGETANFPSNMAFAWADEITEKTEQ